MLLVFGYLLISVGLVFGEPQTWTYRGYNVTIDDGTLQYVKKTKNSSNTLDLHALGIRRINRMAFNGLDNVKTLLLAKNWIKNLPELIFVDLVNLEHLSLKENHLGINESEGAYYFNNVFLGLKKLKSLDISGNPKLRLKQYSFEGLENSVVITADDHLEINDPSLFDKKPEPLILLCRNGGIVRSAKFVDSIEKLRDAVYNCSTANRVMNWSGALHIINLGITEFEKGWYQLKSVTVHYLILSNNEIKRVTSTILNDLPEDVAYVYLSNNPIVKLEKGMIDNKNLLYMDFGNCNINEIEADALAKTSLTRLRLIQNRLKNTSFAETLPTSLEELNIAENMIDRLIPDAFSKLNKLKRLSLRSNLINSLEKNVFAGLRRIEILNLARNRIKDVIDDSFQGLSKNLKKLQLNENKIERLRKGTFVNRVTHELNLSYNKIEEIESGSFNLPELSWLHLAGNSLTIVESDTFVGLPNVVYLDLSDSSIKTIKKGLRKHLDKNGYVVLDCYPKVNDEDADVYDGWDENNFYSLEPPEYFLGSV